MRRKSAKAVSKAGDTATTRSWRHTGMSFTGITAALIGRNPLGRFLARRTHEPSSAVYSQGRLPGAPGIAAQTAARPGIGLLTLFCLPKVWLLPVWGRATPPPSA